VSNVVISRVCNLSCPYCFASDYLESMSGKPGEAFITLDDFKAKLAFLKRSEIHDLRLIGGEPTLHPEFCELVSLGISQGFHILVFTHGLLSDATCDFLAGLTNKDCSLLINMNSQSKARGSYQTLHEKRVSVLKRLNHMATPGFNIYSPDFDLLPIFKAIETTGCHPVIRLGLANPMLNGKNTFLHPKTYRFVGEKIAAYAELCRRSGVHFEFDCGFVRCMFSDDDIEKLTESGTHPQFVCSPILDLDIGNRVFYCFSLADQYIMALSPNLDALAMRKMLTEQSHLYRTAGIYPTCSSCEFKQAGTCSGGCLATTIRRFRVSKLNSCQS